MKKFNVFLCFVFLILSLSLVSSSNAAYNYLPNQLGGNFTWNQSFAEQLFLLLTTANDPLTDSLEINGNLTVNGKYINISNANNPGQIFDVPLGTINSEYQLPSSGDNLSYGGITNWTDPQNATNVLSPYSTNAVGAGVVSNCLYIHNFGFSMPEGSTFSGARVDVQREMLSGGFNDAQSKNVQLVIGGVPQGQNKSTQEGIGTVPSTISYGSSTDNWGVNPTASQVNSNDFGVCYQITSTIFGGNVGVDLINMTVYWTLGGSNEIYQNSSTGSFEFRRNSVRLSTLENGGIGKFTGTLFENSDDRVCTSENGLCNQTSVSYLNQSSNLGNFGEVQFSGTFILDGDNSHLNISLNADTCTGSEVSAFNGVKFTCVTPSGGGGGGGGININNGTDLIQVNVTTLNFTDFKLNNVSGQVDIINRPHLIGAKVYITSDVTGISTTAPVGSPINWTHEEFDTDGFHDNLNGNSRLTVPAGLGGLYISTFNWQWSSTTTGNRLASIIKDSNVSNFLVKDGFGATGTEVRISIVTSHPTCIQEGEWIESYMRSTVSSIDLQASGSPAFSIYRVGDC